MANGVDTDVLIIGAGPVGLFLANECARRGLRWRLVEMHSSQSEYSKALAIFPRTMEIFDMAGVVTPFLEKANRVTSVSISTHERRLAHMQFAPQESAYPFIAMVPQDVTEKLLLEELRRKGGDVEYLTTFIEADQQEDLVNVTLERDGEKIVVTARFVVGCDGRIALCGTRSISRLKEHRMTIPFCWLTSSRMRRCRRMNCNCAPASLVPLLFFR